jgi:hypothetical protein
VVIGGRKTCKEIVENVAASFAKSFLAKTFRHRLLFLIALRSNAKKIVPKSEDLLTIFFQGIHFASSGLSSLLCSATSVVSILKTQVLKKKHAKDFCKKKEAPAVPGEKKIARCKRMHRAKIVSGGIAFKKIISAFEFSVSLRIYTLKNPRRCISVHAQKNIPCCGIPEDERRRPASIFFPQIRRKISAGND